MVSATPLRLASSSLVLSRRAFSLALGNNPPPALFALDTSTTCFTPLRTHAANKSSSSASVTTIARTPFNRAPALIEFDTTFTYGPNRVSAPTICSASHAATTLALANINCTTMDSPSAPSAFVTKMLVLGRFNSTSSSSSSASPYAAVSSPFSSPDAPVPSPTELSEPYQRRSLGPPSMTSSISASRARAASSVSVA